MEVEDCRELEEKVIAGNECFVQGKDCGEFKGRVIEDLKVKKANGTALLWRRGYGSD
jgi:hypothetical protein